MKGKFDFKKDYKFLFTASVKEPRIVEVPDFKYLMVNGQGDPNQAPEFPEKVQALYGLAFTLKFILKLDPASPFDFAVPPLSGLWHAADASAFIANRKEEWQWTLMILQPDAVTPELLEKAKVKLAKKKPSPYIDPVYLKLHPEGMALQILHQGPYSAEGPTIVRLHDFMKKNGYTFNGRHHEIYLNDPHRSKPEKLKTIIRQPVRKI